MTIPDEVCQPFIRNYFEGSSATCILLPINIIFTYDAGNMPGRKNQLVRPVESVCILDLPVPKQEFVDARKTRRPPPQPQTVRQSAVNWQKVSPTLVRVDKSVAPNTGAVNSHANGRRILESFRVELEIMFDRRNVDTFPETDEDVDTIKQLERLLGGMRESWRTRKRMMGKCFACNNEKTDGHDKTMIVFECNHVCCDGCLIALVENTLTATMKCEHEDVDGIPCGRDIKLTEITADLNLKQRVQLNAVLNKQNYTKPKAQIDGVHFCRTKDCNGKWMRDKTNNSQSICCPLCFVHNCTVCEAVHIRMTCAEFNKNRQKIVPVRPECCVCSQKYNRKDVHTVESCQHNICVDCLIEQVRTTDVDLKCPGLGADGKLCAVNLQSSNFPAAIKPSMLADHNVRLTTKLVADTPNSFRCRTKDCMGWWIVEEGDAANAKFIKCPVCKQTNCVVCEVIHKRSTCSEYQRSVLVGRNTVEIDRLKTKLTKRELDVHSLIMRKLVASEAQAQNAVTMMMERPEMAELDICWAARSNSELDAVRKLLSSPCELCCGEFSRNKMFVMVNCEHICCMGCAKQHFSVQIKENSINDCVCPFCQEPKWDSVDSNVDINTYFQVLDPLLRELLDDDVYNVFQKKLTERTLMSDPSFKWCTNCSSGYIVPPNHVAVVCPECKTQTCVKCNVVVSLSVIIFS